jgi:hypothetical protein
MANTITTNSSTTPWAAPYLQNLWNSATGIANRPYQPYQGPQVAGLSDIQMNALNGIQGAMGGNPTTQMASGALQNILGNGGNPNLQAVIDSTTADAVKGFQSQLGGLNDVFSNPNSFGSDRHALGANDLTQSFGKGLGQAIGNIKYGAYDAGLNRQMTAAQLAQGMQNSSMANLMMGLQAGAVPQNLQQNIYNQGQQNFRDQQNYPMDQARFLAGLLGIGGGSNTTQTQPGPNAASQWAGGGLLALSGLGNSGAFGNNGYLTGSNGLFGGMFGGPGGNTNWAAAGGPSYYTGLEGL